MYKLVAWITYDGNWTFSSALGILVGGVSVAFALGVGIGLHSLATAPYRLYRAKVPPDPIALRECLIKAAMVGRTTMGFAVKSDEDFENWKALQTAFRIAFG